MILIPRYDKLSTHIMDDSFSDKLGIFEIQSGPMVMKCDFFALEAIPSCLPTQPQPADLTLNLIKVTYYLHT